MSEHATAPTDFRYLLAANQALADRVTMLESMLFAAGIQSFCILCGEGLTRAQMEAGQPYCATCDPLDPVPA